jgi:hypothetical protein
VDLVAPVAGREPGVSVGLGSKLTLDEIKAGIAAVEAERAAFLDRLTDTDLEKVVSYRGSDGAAACAGDQKKFWEMPNLLFIHQHELASEQLSGYAQTIELDLPAFQKCLSSGRHEGEIRGSIRLANSLGITGTPAYVLARRIPGGDKVEVLEIVHGVRPYEELEKKINALLASK